MRHLYQSLVLVLVLIILCAWAVYPPERKLRLGKDLRGGVSLVYSVQLRSGDSPSEVISRVIDALKQRVDPNGLLEISMVQQGQDRIEVTMPLPNKQVKTARQAFDDALAALGRNELSADRLDRAMRLPPAERGPELEALAGDAARRAILQAAADAYDAMIARRAEVGDGTDVAKLAAAADAEAAYDGARTRAIGSALRAEDIRRVVTASAVARTVTGADGEPVSLPSAREVATKRLLEAHPDAAEQINQLLALYHDYESKRTTLDDPQDLVRMLKGQGELSFRITVGPGEIGGEEERMRADLRTLGPSNVKATDYRWYKLNQIENWVNSKADVELLADDANAPGYFRNMGYVVEPYRGEYYMLCWDTRATRLTRAEGAWQVVRAAPGTDRFGRPSINFAMDPLGAQLLGELTGQHIQKKMAVLLDDQVYTAPNLQSQISSNGEIMGEFTPEEIRYVVQVLGGGSLQARLSPEPIAISSVGPDLGMDNLIKGMEAAVISVIVIAVFMVLYYFRCGFVAVVALLCNGLFLVGAMALSRAAFTMPGIAGVILAFGMAIDSNVLIYERMREEYLRGADLRTCVRLAFERAMSAIIDGNLTNLIVCIVLYYTGTPEIRGFAITMGVGVISTLLSALVVSRVIFEIFLRMGWRKLLMLPIVLPGLQSLLTPRINWMKYRHVFYAGATTLTVGSFALVYAEGREFLDNEFRGGTQVTLQFKPLEGNSGRVTMKRAEVEDRVEQIAAAHPADPQLSQLAHADVITIDPQADGVTSERFLIKTTADEPTVVIAAILEKFSDVMEVKPALSFRGSEATNPREAPVYPVDKPVLGANIDRPSVRNDVSPFLGGAAIVLDNLAPAPTLESLRQRLRTTRETAEFSDTLIRRTEVVVLDGDPSAVKSAVLLVADDGASLFDNEARWETEMRAREWDLAVEALTGTSTTASVHNFSPTIAKTFQAQGTAAALLSFLFTGIYIWVRFKGARYALAATTALVHDVTVVLGLLALSTLLYEHKSTRGFADAVRLLPFKIDLNMVAALLTIVGYSINDKIVIMDRIRENKGKLKYATRDIINLSCNQTFSRTIITGGGVVFSCIVLYFLGGESIRGFAFALLVGVLVGTYSSVVIGAPLVWTPLAEEKVETEPAPA